MYNDSKKKSFGSKGGSRGGYGRGGDRPSFGGGRGGNGGDWKALFPATCATCGTSCEVPFKPNGRKPVYCSNCFKRDGGDDLHSRGESRGAERPAFGDRERTPSFDRAPKTEGIGELAHQMKVMNEKLDAIIEALEGLDGEDEA